MELYKELSEALSEVISKTAETQEFKNRFEGLIENYFDGSSDTRDLQNLIDSILYSENFENGY